MKKDSGDGVPRKQFSLESFFVFNRKIASDDEAASTLEVAEKILFFHPADKTVDQQLQVISLCEGVIDFTRKFSPEKPCETLRMGRAHYTFFECEPETFLVMVVSLKKNTDDGTESTDKEKELDACSLQAIVRDAYGMYTMFNGSFAFNLFSGTYAPTDCMDQIKVARKYIRKAALWKEMEERGDLEPDPEQRKKILGREDKKKELEHLIDISPANRIRRKLRAFLPAYLAIVDFQHLHLFYDMDGFHFFPVDRATYLSIQYFVNMLQTRFKHYIAATAFLFDGHLVWSNFDAQQMRLVYKFLRVREQEAAQRARAARAAAKRLQNKADGKAGSTKQPAGAPEPPQSASASKSQAVKVEFGADTVWSVDDSAIRKQLASASRAAAGSSSPSGSGGSPAPNKRAYQLAAAATTGYMTKGRYLVSFVDQRHQPLGQKAHEASAQLVAVPEIFIPNTGDEEFGAAGFGAEQAADAAEAVDEEEASKQKEAGTERLLVYHVSAPDLSPRLVLPCPVFPSAHGLHSRACLFALAHVLLVCPFAARPDHTGDADQAGHQQSSEEG